MMKKLRHQKRHQVKSICYNSELISKCIQYLSLYLFTLIAEHLMINARHEKAKQNLSVDIAPDKSGCHSHIPPTKNRRCIFTRPVPSMRASSIVDITDQRFDC